MEKVYFSGIKKKKPRPRYEYLQDLFDPDDSFNKYHGHPGMKMRTVKETVYKDPSVDRTKVYMRHLRIMLSYGMSGNTEEGVKDAIERCIAFVEDVVPSIIEGARDDTGFTFTYVDNWECKAPDDAQGIGRLYFLGNAIVGMDTVDAIVIDPLIYNNPLILWPSGCQIERMVAKVYDIPIINDICQVPSIDKSLCETLHGSISKYIDEEHEKLKHKLEE